MDPSYNDSFGSFGNNDTIVVDQGSKRKSKRIMIIMFIVVFLLIIAVVVFFFVQSNKNSLSDIQKYMSLIKYGNNSSNTNGLSYNKAETYYFKEVFYNDDCEQAVGYYNELKNFAESFNDSGDLKELVSEQKSILDMYIANCKIGPLNKYDDMKLYDTNGYNALSEKITKNVDEIKGLKGQYVSSFADGMNEYFGYIVGMVNIYRDNGCGMPTAEDDECVFSQELTDKVAVYSNSIASVIYSISDSLDDALDYFIEQAFTIYHYGEDK